MRPKKWELIKPYSSLYPFDPDLFDSFGGGGGGGGSTPKFSNDECSNPPSVDQLSDWSQYDWDLDARTAAKLGFDFIVGAGFSMNHRMLIREFSRSGLCQCRNGNKARYGTSVRLIVRISEFSIDSKLTLPVVAAETQIGRMQAESSLRVTGYVGNKLANILPPFRTFNVDTYAEMSTKMNDIKKLIGEDIANIKPAKLGIELDPEEIGPDCNEALGLIWGLTRLAEGEPCSVAKTRYLDQGSLIALKAIESAYNKVPNSKGCSSEKPTELQRAYARELLRGLKLNSSGGFWG